MLTLGVSSGEEMTMTDIQNLHLVANPRIRCSSRSTGSATGDTGDTRGDLAC